MALVKNLFLITTQKEKDNLEEDIKDIRKRIRTLTRNPSTHNDEMIQEELDELNILLSQKIQNKTYKYTSNPGSQLVTKYRWGNNRIKIEAPASKYPNLFEN